MTISGVEPWVSTLNIGILSLDDLPRFELRSTENAFLYPHSDMRTNISDLITNKIFRVI